jgi:hypothetical protein
MAYPDFGEPPSVWAFDRVHAEGSRSKTVEPYPASNIAYLSSLEKNIGRVRIWDGGRSDFWDVPGVRHRMGKLNVQFARTASSFVCCGRHSKIVWSARLSAPVANIHNIQTKRTADLNWKGQALALWVSSVYPVFASF